MKPGWLTKKKKYLLASIAGVILVCTGTYLYIDAYKQGDNFKIFMRGILLFIWIIYTISNVVNYVKETR